MQTTHQHHIADARSHPIAAGTVGLVVTSPPYPMIEMWDEGFAAADPAIPAALRNDEGMVAFEAMHRQLDAVWARCFDALRPGGWIAVNIGDATRTLGQDFQLYPNHARVLTGLIAAGFSPMPDILWRKPTNAPNKFMGSGMLPAGAYVTYEHEYILLARKGGKRSFSGKAAENRRRSAFFWEERNVWFSDMWTGLVGVGQGLADAHGARKRSAAFPLQLPHRLICMYSVYEDVILDPFGGTGTTAAAALAAGRSSVTIEQDGALSGLIADTLTAGVERGQALAAQRLAAHQAFVERRIASGKGFKHHNPHHDVPVMTRQERSLALWVPTGIVAVEGGTWRAGHAPLRPPG
ncbi:MAG: site-specific DNA-methyltransferase [Myxococcota bacterium]